MSKAKIKICGLFRECDCSYVNKANPDFAGFIFYPKSHRFVTDSMAEKMRKAINSQIKTVGVFVDDDTNHIKKLYENIVVSIIQLHGNEDNKYIEVLRKQIPQAVIWKAFKIRNTEDIQKAKDSIADMILLDNGYGTGQCFDWSLAENFNRNFILAGGLTQDNITQAIKRFNPYAVDLSSGVETDNKKDLNKILKVTQMVKSL